MNQRFHFLPIGDQETDLGCSGVEDSRSQVLLPAEGFIIDSAFVCGKSGQSQPSSGQEL